MTVSNIYAPALYLGDGGTVAFAFPYPFFTVTDLVVQWLDASDDSVIEPPPVLGTTYTVTGTRDSETQEYLSGTVTFAVAPPASQKILISRAVSPLQTVDLADDGPFPANAVEAALDRAMMAIQDLSGVPPSGGGGDVFAPVTPQMFGAKGDGVTNDTAAFVAMADAYFLTGRAVAIPDTGAAYLIDADQVIFKPPLHYNNAYLPAPAITMDKSARIKARTGGTFLIQIGTLQSDYNGLIRFSRFDLGVIDGDFKTFTKAPLYFPFFLGLGLNVTAVNAKRCIWYGDTAAPAASGGVKGDRWLEWQFHMWRRDVVGPIPNAVNPIITLNTFNAAWPTWPSSGRCVVCLVLEDASPAWTPIADIMLDAVILSATQIQLLNVDTSSYGATPGHSICYLNSDSSRVPKRIAGVTNANPAVITTEKPHLLTNGETVDIGEIRQMPSFCGQFAATVLSPTTFSVPFNTSALFGWSSYGPGWVMPWVPPRECSIGEFFENAGDCDDGQGHSQHFRIHKFHNPLTSGWDGKQGGTHCYNFPMACEILCAHYIAGDNNAVQVQCDGPMRYVFWAAGPSNVSSDTSTNCGWIDPRDAYGAIVRTEPAASWVSYHDRLKGFSGMPMFAEHVGLGDFKCEGTLVRHVTTPRLEAGEGRNAARVRFDNAAVINSYFMIGSVTKIGTGLFQVSFVQQVPLECEFHASVGGPAGCIVTQDEIPQFAGTSAFVRQIRIVDPAGNPVDPNRVSAEWLYPQYP